MAKWVLLDAANLVQHVKTDPSNTDELTAWGWFESSDDSVDVGHEWDGTNFHAGGAFAKYRDKDVARKRRDDMLLKCDWAVLEDSPWKASGKESDLASIKTYRQTLRDLFNDASLDLTNADNWPKEPNCLLGIDTSLYPS